jgi:hypothetical protein
MEKLCQDILASHQQRQTLLKQLKDGAVELKKETTQMLKGFRKQLGTLRDDFQAGREAWQKAATSLAKKRQHARAGSKS